MCQSCDLSEYIFTDCHCDVLDKLRENLEINDRNTNFSSRKKEVLCLDWTETNGSLKNLDKKIDFVIATGI